MNVSVGVIKDKSGAIDLLIRAFWMLVSIYRYIWVGLICFERKVSYEKLFGDSTYSCQNVGYGVLWMLVVLA